MSDETPTPNLLATMPVPAPGADALTEIMSAAGSGVLMTWASFQPQTTQERALYYAALDGETLGFAEILNNDIAIKNIAFQVRDAADKETGEVSRRIRTILFLADGRVASGESVYVARSMRNLMQSGIMPPWHDPVRGRLVQIEVTGGRMYRFRYDGGGGSTPIDEKPIGKAKARPQA